MYLLGLKGKTCQNRLRDLFIYFEHDFMEHSWLKTKSDLKWKRHKIKSPPIPKPPSQPTHQTHTQAGFRAGVGEGSRPAGGMPADAMPAANTVIPGLWTLDYRQFLSVQFIVDSSHQMLNTQNTQSRRPYITQHDTIYSITWHKATTFIVVRELLTKLAIFAQSFQSKTHRLRYEKMTHNKKIWILKYKNMWEKH